MAEVRPGAVVKAVELLEKLQALEGHGLESFDFEVEVTKAAKLEQDSCEMWPFLWPDRLEHSLARAWRAALDAWA